MVSLAQPRADSRSFGHLWTLYDGIRQNYVRDQRQMLDTIQWKAEAEHDAYQLFIVNHKRLLLGRQQQDLSLQDAVLWLDSLRRDNVAARWGDPDSAIYHSLYHYLTGLLLATAYPYETQTTTIHSATFWNMEEWSKENFNEEAKKQYASCFAGLPKGIPLNTSRWDFLLVTIPETRPLRPTLNDVLYQSCISLFGEDDPEFAGALVDEAMAAHTERNILVDYEIQRLHFIFPHVQENVDSSASWRKLDSLEQKYGADVAFDYERGLQLAVAYQLTSRETDYMERAVGYFDKVIRQSETDESGNPLLHLYGQNAAYYLDKLTRPRLALVNAPLDLPLGHKLRIPIQYSNLETIYVSVYPFSDIVSYKTYFREVEGREIESFQTYFKWDEFFEKKICTQRFDLAAAGRFATTELWMDSLPVGNYRFFFHTKPELDEAGVLMEADFRVTRLKLSTWSVMRKKGVIAVNDCRTGEPLPGKWGRGANMVLFPHLSNRFGEIRYARGLVYRDPCSVYDNKVAYSTTDWEPIDPFSLFHHHGYSLRAHLFTDRTLYRPGQIVRFKYILSKKGRALKDVSVMALLFGEKSTAPDTLRLTTSRYGSVSGEFQLPKVVGKYRLVVAPVSNKNKKKQRRYFSFAERKQIEVAEYKLPTFKVRLESDSQQVAAGDTFTIRGKVTALNGVPVRNAAVVLNVKTNFTAKQERLDVVTEQDGRFAYRYPVTRNTYRLDVEAIVTDINGETHSDKSMVMISQDLLTIHLSDDKDVDLALDDTARWRVTAVNYCDIVQNVPLRITVVRLDAPKEYRIPAFDKTPAYWRPLHSEEEYAREFPHLTFNLHANDAAYWPALDTCFRGVTTSSSDSLLKIVVKNWNVGNYKMLVDATDKVGNAVSKTTFFTVNNSSRTDFRTFQPIRAEFISVPPKKGKPLQISVGSSLDKAVMVCDVYQGKRRLKTWSIPLNREQKTVKVRTHSNGNRGLSLCARIVQNGQLHSVVRDTFVEMDNSTHRKLLRRYHKLMMNAELTHYRDVSEPGSDEHWEITLADGKGKTMRQAELLAWMIDGSLHELGMWKTDYGAYYYPKRVRIPDYLNVNGSQIKCRDISNSYTNYYCNKENKTPKSRLYYESVIRPMQDFYYSSRSADVQEVVVKYEPPVFDTDNTVSESNVARSLANMAGVSSVDGQMASVRGNRSEGTRVIVDGVRVRNDSPGLAFPQPAVAEPAVPEPSLAPEVKVRSHFVETAFFEPSLHPDDSGRVHIRFTLPDQYTGWEFYAFGHSKDMRTSRMRALLQSRRTLMLQSNAPRFFREGDTLTLRAKITNCGEESQEGNVMLEFFNAEDNRPLEMILGEESMVPHLSAKGSATFHVAAGTSEVVQFRIRVPEGVSAVTYRMMARTGSYGDGEENILPVLPNKMLVTEACTFTVPAGQDAAFTFQHYRTHTTPTMQPLNYTLEVTTNPAWLAIRALPYLMRYPYECNEQIFSKIFAAATVQHMLAQTPALREVFDSWLNDTVNEALASPLLKNVSLQSMLLEETPWLHDAQSESRQRQETAKLFADENLQRQLEKNINKLLHNQLLNGGWDWYGKNYYSRYITNYIVSGFYKLQRLGVEIPQADKMLGKAIRRSDDEQEDRYQSYLKRKEKEPDAQFFFSEEDLYYLYARSFAPYDAAWLSRPFVKNLMALMTKDLRKTSFTRQAEVALILYRTGREAEAKEIMEYIRQQAVTDREKGMYWRKEFSGSFYCWYEAPIERQALLIEAFTEIAPRADELTAMKHWLLCQKRGNNWPSTKATSEAVYALLLDAPANLLRPSTTVVTVGGETLKPAEDARAEAGTGYLQQVWQPQEMTPELAEIHVRADSVHPVFGACYWQYLEVPDQVEAAGSGLTVRRTLYHQPAAGDGRTAEPVTGDNPIHLGERITVRVVVSSDRDLEYVQVKDPRASAFEPVNIHERSGRQDGVWWVESPRDASTNFFFSRFPQGTVVLEYDVFATQTGDFSLGATTVECMYAPEYRAQSAGTRIQVGSK
jgi:hypothetical protein